MEKGDLVLVNYIGRQDGDIFDLTVEEKAEEEGLDTDERDFSPIPVLIGEGFVIEGFEDAVLEMEVGDEEEVAIPTEKAYGERESEKVQTYPEKEFEKQGVNVRQGEEIMVGSRRGKIISKGSGRVRVDFNHPLAGKGLEYWIKVVEKVEEAEEKAKHIYSYRVGHDGGELKFEDGESDAKVKIPKTHSHGDQEHELPEELLEEIQQEIENYTGLEVEFVESE